MSSASSVQLHSVLRCGILAVPHGSSRFGFDFAIDAAHRVWFLEANQSPNLGSLSGPGRQKDRLRQTLSELLDLVTQNHEQGLSLPKEAAPEGTAVSATLAFFFAPPRIRCTNSRQW